MHHRNIEGFLNDWHINAFHLSDLSIISDYKGFCRLRTIYRPKNASEIMVFQLDHQWDILSPGRIWDILSLGQFVTWGESGTFCHLGQFVAQKMPMGQFVVGTKCLLTILLIFPFFPFCFVLPLE